MCDVVWFVGDEWLWYLSYIKEIVDDCEYIVDHLHRVKGGLNTQWRYPPNDDTSKVFNDQILQVNVTGNWDIANNARHMKYILENSEDIEKQFKSHVNV